MKNRFCKRLAILLLAMLFIPFIWNYSTVTAKAATTPTLTKTKVTLDGVGDTYDLNIKNKVAKSTYKWTTSNKKIVKVTSKGIMTAVSEGSATVKCVITYPTKKTKTLTCKVTVTIPVPATSVTISNAKEANGAHVMTLGTTYDFDSILLPSAATDTTYWAIGKKYENAGIIRIDDAQKGIVTALKAGKATLEVYAVQTATAAEAKKSVINDSIIIEVVEPTATVKSVEITGSNVITVVFDSPVDRSTVINTSNQLTANITLSLVSGYESADPGTLTPSLSTDLTTLTITTKNALSGTYGVNFTDKIKTSAGVAMEPYYTQISYVDKTPPTVTGVTLDDTGYTNIIQFSEAIDITNLKASNAQITSGTAADQATFSILNNKGNYILSGDKKSLTINLSPIASTDYNKAFTVVLSGIRDLAGNAPANGYYTAMLRTDTTPRAQAVPSVPVRTAYNVVTVTFSRGIQSPGMLQLNNGAFVSGVVDSENNKKVHYTISDSDAALTGSVKVFLVDWNSYNVKSTDVSALNGKTFTINFSAETVKPVLVVSEYDVENNYLTLTYSEAVTPALASGVIVASRKTLTNDIEPGILIYYTTVTTEDSKVVKLKLNNLSVLGTYTLTLEEGFVRDAFNNTSVSRDISISNGSSTSTELPAPYEITQSTTNRNEIYVKFANKIDVASAINIGNYSIAGVTIQSARVYENTDRGATVILTLAGNSIEYTLAYTITINGILGYNGSFSALTDYVGEVTLTENRKPYLVSGPTFNKSSMDIVFTFSEEIQGTMVATVKEYSTGLEIGNNISISGTTATLTLDYVPAKGTYLLIQVLSAALDITDTSGNSVVGLNPSYGIVVSY